MTTSVAIIILLLPKIWISNYEKTESWMISTTIIWLCFVPLEAYYGGALTMFFTSEVTIPFETLTDVLEAYPSWKLNVKNGLQMQFQGSNVPKVILI